MKLITRAALAVGAVGVAAAAGAVASPAPAHAWDDYYSCMDELYGSTQDPAWADGNYDSADHHAFLQWHAYCNGIYMEFSN